MYDASRLPSAPINPLSDPHRLMAWPTVLHVTGKSEVEIYAMMAREEFPKPITIGRRRVAWRAGDIGAWLRSRSNINV
jgi:prophage regulatory protein